ncbi:MAG: hypothetical protein OXP69_23150 [Spirochaetaceae bacterium]|nr:hypothetical protein [Spirochaetaceae bacterium]
MSEEELSTTGAQKMLLDWLDRLEEENLELREIEKRFHESDKDVAVLQERQTKSIARDIMLAAGSLLLGLSPSFWAVQPTGTILVIIGGALAVASVVGPYGHRVFKRIGLR